MTARAIGEILSRAQPKKHRRTFQPVRRNSYNAGEREGRIWKPLAASSRETRKIIALRMKAAESYDRKGKRPGKRNGPLGHIGLEVLRTLYAIVDFRTGRLEPSIDWICEKLKRSRAAVVSALARLRQNGFLDWVRRTEPVDNDGAGPQVRQITNAYWFGVPAAVAGWIARKISPAPLPDDEADRITSNDRAVKDMLEEEGFEATARYVAGDSALGDILARIGRSKDQSASSLNDQNPDPE